jgi:hypothetical protein
MWYSLVEIYRRFRGTYRRHLSGLLNNRLNPVDPEDEGSTFFRNVDNLYQATWRYAQKIEHFVVTAVRTSNVTSVTMKHLFCCLFNDTCSSAAWNSKSQGRIQSQNEAIWELETPSAERYEQ